MGRGLLLLEKITKNSYFNSDGAANEDKKGSIRKRISWFSGVGLTTGVLWVSVLKSTRAQRSPVLTTSDEKSLHEAGVKHASPSTTAKHMTSIT